jgi:hypothetical protein
MTFVYGDQEIETIAPEGSHEPFTESVRRWGSRGRPQDAHAKVFQRFIHSRREDGIAVVNQEPIGMIEIQELAELLRGPFRGGVFRDINVEHPAGADFLATNTYIRRKVAVAEMRKSQATVALEWFLTKVAHFCPELRRVRSKSKYLRTVRGEISIPSLSFNSSAIRSSPQVGFSRSIARINSQMFRGNSGRPRFRDFQRQNIRNAVRCHLINVSGLTTTSASRQSKKRASAIIASRAVLVICCGFAFRSLKSESCFRRNRFSAIMAARAVSRSRKKVSNRCIVQEAAV